MKLASLSGPAGRGRWRRRSPAGTGMTATRPGARRGVAWCASAGRVLLPLLLAGLLLGCGRDNGLPRDLGALAQAQGLTLRPVRTSAPLNQRGGYVVVRAAGTLTADLVAAFALQPLAADDRGWQLMATHVLGAPVATQSRWGIAGRPPQLKLKGGGQFEYLYLLLTPTGELYVIAEYAYG